jgi:hypothetical protein
MTRAGDQLMQKFQQLWRYLHIQLGYAREITTRPVQATHEAKPNRVRGCFEDGRDIRGRGLCRKRCSSSQRGNDGHLTSNQIVRQSGQPIVLIPRKAIFDRNVLILDKACLLESLMEGGDKLRPVAGRART